MTSRQPSSPPSIPLAAPLPSSTTTTQSPNSPIPPPTTSSSDPTPTPNHPLAPAADASPEIQALPRHSGGSDRGKAQAGAITPPVPMVHLRVLLISGQSHVFSFEPETTVGRMKELVWSMWPSDWTAPAQPPSPSFLRVLHAGRILGDDSTLESNNLAASLQANNPTVIHLSVRSFSIRGEDDPKKPSLLHPTTSRASRNRAGGDEVGGGCKCVIM